MVDGIIREVMNRPIGIENNKKIKDVIEKILSHKISRVFVYDSKKPVGIISEKDILSFLFHDKQHRSISQVPLTEIMRNIFFMDGNSAMNKAAQFLVENKCSSVAVGSTDDFKGVVTKTDLTRYYAENEKNKNKVANWMSIHYFSVRETDPLYDVIKTMLGFAISRMIIIDKKKQPLGIISTGDLLKTILKMESQNITENSQFKSKGEEFWSNYVFFCSQPAGSIMIKNIIKVKASDDLANACEIMLGNDINALGVEDDDRQLAGVVGKRDVLLALAKM